MIPAFTFISGTRRTLWSFNAALQRCRLICSCRCSERFTQSGMDKTLQQDDAALGFRSEFYINRNEVRSGITSLSRYYHLVIWSGHVWHLVVGDPRLAKQNRGTGFSFCSLAG